MKKTQTQTRSWRKKGYLNSLFRKLWIFFFDTTPKLDKWQFLKGELWCGIWNHIYKCHTLLHENPHQWIFYPSWFCNISYWSHGKSHSPSQANLWNIDSFHCTLSKDTFVNITADLNRKILRVLWNCQSHSGRYRFSKNSNFCLKACFYHWQQILSIVFFDVTGSLRSLLIKSLPNTQVWITIVFLSFTLLSKNGISWNTISWISKIQLATQSLISFSLR